jgi:hypothetical protein
MIISKVPRVEKYPPQWPISSTFSVPDSGVDHFIKLDPYVPCLPTYICRCLGDDVISCGSLKGTFVELYILPTDVASPLDRLRKK